MSNVQRWRYEPDKPRQYAVDSGNAIQIGDLAYFEVDDVRAAGSMTYGDNLENSQMEFRHKFAGVAAQASASLATDPIRILSTGVFEFPCASAIWELHDLVAIDDNAGGTALTPQQVIKTLNPDAAIGRVVKAEASAVTEIMVELWSQYSAPALIEAGGEANVVRFFEDFFGLAVSTGGPWAVVDTGDATEAMVADDGGVFRLHIHATSEAEDAVLYFGDLANFSLTNLQRIRFRARVQTIPTDTVELVMGVVDAHNLDDDTVGTSCWFKLQNSADLLMESDDTATDEDDIDTLLNLVATKWHIFEIDFTDLTDIKFYMDGLVCTDAAPTTFVQATGATLVQPYFSLDKASGAGVADLDIDWIEILSLRD